MAKFLTKHFIITKEPQNSEIEELCEVHKLRFTDFEALNFLGRVSAFQSAPVWTDI